MRKLTLLPLFCIQIFAEGGGGDGGTGAAAAGQSEAAPAQPQDVVYGVQEESPKAEIKQPEDRNAQFDALIKGEYKEAYEQRLKDTVARRLKGTEETVARYNALAPTLDLLAGKYGVDVDDVEGLAKAIQEDESYYEDEALDLGISVQQVKEMRRMRRENAELKAQMEEQNTRQQADALYASWLQQAETVKQVYPSFDLQAELQNEAFRNLLRSHIPVQTAFEVIHHDEILPAAMQYTAKKVEEKVANNVRAGKNRPAEGAMKSHSAAVYKSDVSQLTDADMAEINRRVMRGERIRF